MFFALLYQRLIKIDMLFTVAFIVLVYQHDSLHHLDEQMLAKIIGFYRMLRDCLTKFLTLLCF